MSEVGCVESTCDDFSSLCSPKFLPCRRSAHLSGVRLYPALREGSRLTEICDAAVWMQFGIFLSLLVAEDLGAWRLHFVAEVDSSAGIPLLGDSMSLPAVLLPFSTREPSAWWWIRVYLPRSCWWRNLSHPMVLWPSCSPLFRLQGP